MSDQVEIPISIDIDPQSINTCTKFDDQLKTIRKIKNSNLQNQTHKFHDFLYPFIDSIYNGLEIVKTVLIKLGDGQSVISLQDNNDILQNINNILHSCNAMMKLPWGGEEEQKDRDNLELSKRIEKLKKFCHQFKKTTISSQLMLIFIIRTIYDNNLNMHDTLATYEIMMSATLEQLFTKKTLIHSPEAINTVDLLPEILRFYKIANTTSAKVTAVLNENTLIAQYMLEDTSVFAKFYHNTEQKPNYIQILNPILPYLAGFCKQYASYPYLPVARIVRLAIMEREKRLIPKEKSLEQSSLLISQGDICETCSLLHGLLNIIELSSQMENSFNNDLQINFLFHNENSEGIAHQISLTIINNNKTIACWDLLLRDANFGTIRRSYKSDFVFWETMLQYIFTFYGQTGGYNKCSMSLCFYVPKEKIPDGFLYASCITASMIKSVAFQRLINYMIFEEGDSADIYKALTTSDLLFLQQDSPALYTFMLTATAYQHKQPLITKEKSIISSPENICALQHFVCLIVKSLLINSKVKEKEHHCWSFLKQLFTIINPQFTNDSLEHIIFIINNFDFSQSNYKEVTAIIISLLCPTLKEDSISTIQTIKTAFQEACAKMPITAKESTQPLELLKDSRETGVLIAWLQQQKQFSCDLANVQEVRDKVKKTIKP